MNFPKLKQPVSGRQTLDTFGGYNHNLRIGDGEFYQMRNMTSDYFPVLSPREKRGSAHVGAAITGIAANHGLCYTAGSAFYLPGGHAIDLGLSDGPKSLVTMGAYVIILPDKKWVNVAAFEEGAGEEAEMYGDIEAFWQTSDDRGAGYTLCKADGTEIISNATIDIPTKKPEDPADGAYWIDDSAVPPVLKKWNAEMGMWIRDTDTYLKIFGDGLLECFNQGDAVQITGLDGMYSGEGKQMIHAPGESAVIVATGRSVPWFSPSQREYEFIVVPGFSDNAFYTKAPLSIRRRMPDMDFVFESGNRLWGCKYGVTEDGFINEIYCSKLGSFQNWNSFRGISTDSYVASVGADGPFTGGIACLGRPIFFKENCMIEVYGGYPSDYQVQTTPCDGVQAGCEKSLAIVNNVLFYKSRAGVCAFDGSLPVQIGQVFGRECYENAAAGGCDSKYYISMRDAKGWNLFVYDTARGLWHREDELQAAAFCTCGGMLYCLEADGSLQILRGSKNTEEGDISWMVCTGQIGMSLPDSKYISRLSLRLSVEPGARVAIYAQYDHSSRWEHLYSLTGTQLRSFTVPIRPKRCDHMVLKLEGTGPAKIYSLTKTIQKGSDVF